MADFEYDWGMNKNLLLQPGDDSNVTEGPFSDILDDLQALLITMVENGESGSPDYFLNVQLLLELLSDDPNADLARMYGNLWNTVYGAGSDSFHSK